MSEQAPVVVVLGPLGLETARRIRAVVPGARLHGLKGRVDAAELAETFSDGVDHLRRLFASGSPIIGICASGILVRALGPVLQDKQAEPPVLAVAVDGSAVVPLLGGHHGANALARTIARVFDVAPAITTAGDARFGLALDEPPPGWRVANPPVARRMMAALVDGRPVALEVEAGDAGWIRDSGAPFADGAELTVRVTDKAVPGDDRTLVLHPPSLVVGVGCERGVAPGELSELVSRTLADHGLAAQSVAAVTSLDLKADEPAVLALARALGVPARFFAAAALEAETPRLATPSDVVFRAVGCHGVAEGAALAAVGRDGRLVVAKAASERATCAVARAATTVDPATVGRGRGTLHVVGIGPGAAHWRTPEASAAVADARHLVGYGLYLDLLGEAAAGRTRHESALGAEDERVRVALDLAAAGETVALVCSGDAGIYALASLVFERLDRDDRPDWNRIEINVVPGVSALQAAAARVGAPLGHDFCAISLSDLLTPWEVIERRVAAAAAGDFVIAFYNPVSQRRRDQLVRARDILLGGRSPETPVILARKLGREGERIEVIRLADLDAGRADMLTLVMVGSSETRVVTRGGRSRVYTPRGYAAKG
ncbi:MAG: precorrin-3B C(17)-methyltransferase [Alphaproteobacteria bacterium]